MKRIFALIMLLAIAAFSYSQEGVVTQKRREAKAFEGDSLRVRTLDPRFDYFPDSQLVDFSYLLEAPAGQRGFVRVGDDGHFHFGDGTRVRFWGVTVSQEHVDVPHDRIDRCVEEMARSGSNLLRLHAMDNRGAEQYGVIRRSIIDDASPHNNDSQHFDAEYFDRIDYWIAKAKEHGMYIYLVLRGYRTFRAGDGVANADKLDRAAKPQAFFDPRLIELQKQYADEFLFKHVNPYTGLSYASDPAVALIEVFNEDSLFMQDTNWSAMIEPYRSQLRKLWNDWLRERYGSSEALGRAWTSASGEKALGADEKLEDASVQLPDMTIPGLEGAMKAAYNDPLRSPVRRRDAAKFAIEVQRRYFRTMRDFLREKGLRVPMCGVVGSQVIPDTLSTALEFDFTAENCYQDHPSFEPYRTWVSAAYFKNKNYLKEMGAWSYLPFVTRYKWAGKPLVVREWDTCFPNEYRATSILETAAYALYQDFDAMIFFQYDTTGSVSVLGTFGIQCDPARWGLFGLAAQMFLRGDVRTAQKSISIAYSEEDAASFYSFIDSLHTLSWYARLENYFNQSAEKSSRTDLTIVSGRTHQTGYRGNRGIIFCGSEFADFGRTRIANGEDTIQFKSGYTLEQVPIQSTTFAFSGYGYEEGETATVEARTGFRLAEVEGAGYQPVGIDKQNGVALGFFDAKRENFVFGAISPAAIPRFALDLLAIAGDRHANHQALAHQQSVSDTGELQRDSDKGVLRIVTDKFLAVEGELEPGKEYEAGPLKVISQSPIAVVAVVSLDGKPLKDSEKFLVKMVTVAQNRGQVLAPSENPALKDHKVLASSGSAPITTLGKQTDVPTRIFLGGEKLLDVYLKNGTWEVVFDFAKKEYLVTCDTINTKFVLYPLAGRALTEKADSSLTMTRYFYEYSKPETRQAAAEFIYPGYSKYVRLSGK